MRCSYVSNVDDINVFSVIIQVYNVTSRHLKDGNINFSSMGKIAYTLNSYSIEFLAFQRSVRLTFHHSPNHYPSKGSIIFVVGKSPIDIMEPILCRKKVP